MREGGGRDWRREEPSEMMEIVRERWKELDGEGVRNYARGWSSHTASLCFGLHFLQVTSVHLYIAALNTFSLPPSFLVVCSPCSLCSDWDTSEYV